MTRVIRQLALIAAVVMVSGYGYAQMSSTCVSGCEPRDELEQTPDLLLRADETTAVEIRWRSSSPPAGDGETVVLYFGNPAMRDALDERPLEFESVDGQWTTRLRFDGDQLGRGSFLTVVVHRKGQKETILEWRAWRLLTLADRERQRLGPPPASAWELDIVPALLQVKSGRGDLPHSRGGDATVWWSLALLDDQFVDLEIDGEHTGVPGLSIHMTQPWPAGKGPQGWMEKVLDPLDGVDGHQVRVGDLEWVEPPPREPPPATKDERLSIRYYYTIVSLFSTASSATLDKSQVGGGRKRTFSHETSARLKSSRDPRFWPSYSRRELGADPHLLDLLERQTRGDGRVPGLVALQRGGGDGGPPVFRVGFTARISAWETGNEEEKKSGFIAMDAVAARAGHVGVVTKGSSGRSEIELALCRVMGCDAGGSEIDLDDPPRGYKVWAPSASLKTKTGSLPMATGEPTTAARKVGTKNFPDTARFAVAAHLRSGALVRKGSFGKVLDVAPLNAYAQFVVKFTVAEFSATELITNDEALVLDPSEGDLMIALPEPGGFLAWIAAHKTLVGLIVLGVFLLALMLFLPGLRALVNAIFRALAALVERRSGSGGNG